LSWNTDSESLRNRFSKFGTILDAVVIRDRETGRSRGFGFVTFEDDESANAAVSTMNDSEFDGRTIRVAKTEERERRPFEPRQFNGGERRSFGRRPYNNYERSSYRSSDRSSDRASDRAPFSPEESSRGFERRSDY